MTFIVNKFLDILFQTVQPENLGINEQDRDVFYTISTDQESTLMSKNTGKCL